MFFACRHLWTLCIAAAFCNCSGSNKEQLKVNKQDFIEAHPSLDSVTRANCKVSLWLYVYSPHRLKILKQCTTVLGTIVESHADEDGDQHLLLRLDSGQEELINRVNQLRKNGNLVIEAVCVNAVKLDKVGATCKGYVNQVALPTVGDHVQVTGSYVQDLDNGWMEIHPIMHLVVL